MATTKVVLRVKTWKKRAGDTIEVDSATAKQLIADGRASRAPTPAKKADKS